MSQQWEGKGAEQIPDPEVEPKAHRRQFSAEYKRRILQEYEACSQHGEKGALLRREGLYSSNITDWRRQRAHGELAGLASKKPGPKSDPQAEEMARLKGENEGLRRRLEQAELIIEVQKKVSQILGLSAEQDEGEEAS